MLNTIIIARPAVSSLSNAALTACKYKLWFHRIIRRKCGGNKFIEPQQRRISAEL